MAYLGTQPAAVQTDISTNSITTSMLTDNSVTASKLANTSVTAGTYGNATIVPIITVDADGRATTIANATILIANTQITGNTISSKLEPTGVTAAVYGNATLVPTITVDQQGRITSASNTAIVVSVNSVTGNLSISGNVRPATYQETFANVVLAAGNINLNLSNATVFRTVVTGVANVILQNPPPANVGYSLVLQLFQTGSYAITWPASIQWPNNTAPTLSTTSGYVDTIALYTVDGGTNYYGTSVLGQF